MLLVSLLVHHPAVALNLLQVVVHLQVVVAHHLHRVEVFVPALVTTRQISNALAAVLLAAMIPTTMVSIIHC